VNIRRNGLRENHNCRKRSNLNLRPHLVSAHPPDDCHARGDRGEAKQSKLILRDLWQKPRHPHKKTRGQRIGQPLDDQQYGDTCEQVVHDVSCRQVLPA